jgi:hypothetical protein
MYYAAGIPSEYWQDTKHTFRFKPFKIVDTDDCPMTSIDAQSTWWQKLSTTPGIFTRPHLVWVCVKSHESMAMSMAFDLTKAALHQGMRVQVDNAAHCDTNPDVLEPFAVLLNVADSGTTDRRQKIRDWIHAYQASFRILCIAGDPTTALSFLDIRPTIAFHLNPVVAQVRA